MSPEELLDAINIQLQLQDNEQKAERILLRQELTESNNLVNRLVQTIDRWIGATPSTPTSSTLAGSPTPALASRLMARFSTPTVPAGLTLSSTLPSSSPSLPMSATPTTPAVASTSTPEVARTMVPPLVPSVMPPQALLEPDHDAAPTIRIRRSEKITWPKCPATDDPSMIKAWRMKFLASLNTCDLDMLFDPFTHDLVKCHPDANAVKVLYGIIQACLPDGHPMILNRSYWGQGLNLWHAFSASVIPALTFHKRQDLIQTLFHHTTRLSSEDVYTYYNRLITDADDINLGTYPPSISPSDLRRRFLFSLGPELEFLKIDDVEGRLDPTYLTSEPEPLLHRLQAILHTKQTATSFLPTVSSSGYANAVQKVRDPTEDRLNTLADVIGDIHSQLALLRPQSSTPIVVPTSAPVPPETQFYCWSHGVCKHHGADCTKPLPNHNPKATFSNRMGGSAYVKTYRQ